MHPNVFVSGSFDNLLYCPETIPTILIPFVPFGLGPLAPQINDDFVHGTLLKNRVTACLRNPNDKTQKDDHNDHSF
jgi:hypothetical protein